MKANTILKRLEKVNVSKNSAAYRLIKNTVSEGKNFIRTCWTSGSGRFCKNLDYTNEVIRILSAINVKFEFGNDAPRGGLTGNFVKILNF